VTAGDEKSTVGAMAPGPTDLHACTPAELRERVLAERRGLPFLVYRDGGGAQVIVELSDEHRHLTVGRRDGNDVTLRWDPEVSRVHAELLRIGDDWVVCDEGLSHNGTFVNGERLHGRRRLRGGDLIAIGSTVIAVQAPPPGSTASATRTGHQAAPLLVTPAQRRVLVALCRPMAAGRYDAPASNRRIADELFLSVDTVKGTLRQLFELFGLDGVSQNEKRAALARQALDRGIVRRSEL
jgi:pSer/pThr/pTyr-binding forkhead associated (FHA) protein